MLTCSQCCSCLWVTQFSFMSPQDRQQLLLGLVTRQETGIAYGCGGPEVCQGLSLSSSCPNLQLAMNSHPHVIPKHVTSVLPPPCGRGRHIQVCSADQISSSFIPSFTPLLPGASPLRQRTSTDSCLDTLLTQSHTKNLAVFPTKAACPSWRQQQLMPAVPGCSSNSQTPHTGPG